jgi:hypothetical protein
VGRAESFGDELFLAIVRRTRAKAPLSTIDPSGEVDGNPHAEPAFGDNRASLPAESLKGGTAEHHQIRAPWVFSFDGWDGQVLRTPVPVGAAGWPTSQDN